MSGIGSRVVPYRYTGNGQPLKQVSNKDANKATQTNAPMVITQTTLFSVVRKFYFHVVQDQFRLKIFSVKLIGDTEPETAGNMAITRLRFKNTTGMTVLLRTLTRGE